MSTQPAPHANFLKQWIALGLGMFYSLQRERAVVTAIEQDRLRDRSQVLQVSIEQNLASIRLSLAPVRSLVTKGTAGNALNEQFRLMADTVPSVQGIEVLDADTPADTLLPIIDDLFKELPP